jgi:hypothetical protein
MPLQNGRETLLQNSSKNEDNVGHAEGSELYVWRAWPENDIHSTALISSDVIITYV